MDICCGVILSSNFCPSGKMSDRVLDSVIENSCVLLNAKQREILQSCLALIKVLVASFPDTRLSCYLEKLVKISIHP